MFEEATKKESYPAGKVGKSCSFVAEVAGSGAEGVSEEIVNPARYVREGSIECWDYWVSRQFEPLLASAVKYLWRQDRKGGAHDLRKAIVFIEKAISEVDYLIARPVFPARDILLKSQVPFMDEELYSVIIDLELANASRDKHFTVSLLTGAIVAIKGYIISLEK